MIKIIIISICSFTISFVCSFIGVTLYDKLNKKNRKL